MMLTYHISHEKFFSTFLYVPGRSGVNKIFTQIIIINNWNDELFGIDKYKLQHSKSIICKQCKEFIAYISVFRFF